MLKFEKIFGIIFCWLAMYIIPTKAESLIVQFDKKDFNISLSDSIVTLKSNDLGYFYKEDISLPALLYKAVNIPVHYTTSGLNFTTEVQKELLYENVYLMQNERGYISTDTMYIAPEISTMSVKDPVEYIFLERNMKNVSALFSVAPFVYDYAEKKLYFVSSVSITLHDLEYKASIPVKRFPKNSSIITTPQDSVDYMVITSRDLMDAFKPLCQWKRQKGLRTKIMAVEDIYELYEGATPQLKIKSCLYNHYDLGLKWALLGGDVGAVPIQQCYLRYGPIGEDYIPADQFYSCFDGAFDWDKNGNGIVGENVDDVDFIPEICVSRVPVNSVDDVSNFIGKLLKYEIAPSPTNYMNRMLFSGAKITELLENGTKSDSHMVGLNIYNNYVTKYWGGEGFFLYDTGGSWGDSYGLRLYGFVEQIDSGYHFLYVNTHGNCNCWQLSSSLYTTFDVNRQRNRNATIILTSACLTNAFDSELTSLGEAFINNPNGVCVAYAGFSRESASYSGGDPSGSNLYGAMFFEYLFSGKSFFEPYRLGDIVTLAKMSQRPMSNGYFMARWNQLNYNLLGDPEMTIYTDDPQKFNVTAINVENGTIFVNSGGVDSCIITMVGTSPASDFQVIKCGSSCEFDIPNEPVVITITKHNYIPLMYYVNGTDIYIQNKEFSTAILFSAENVYMGNFVTTMKDSGDVVISLGAGLIIESQGRTILDKGTICKKGGSIYIPKLR